ncbi:hypothetical protein ACX8XN_00085 [Calditrichota bacterium GD2]
MKERIVQMDWKHKLQYSGKPNKHRAPHKHERLKYRIITFLERKIFKRPIGGFRNYVLLKDV